MIQEVSKQFTGSVNMSWEPGSKAGIFALALIKFNSAPTTSESIIITFVSQNGTDYDTVLHVVNPSTDSLINVVYSPNVAIPMNEGDKVRVTYPNTDGRTISITLKGLDSSSF